MPITRVKPTYKPLPKLDLQVDYFNGGLNKLQEENRLKKSETPQATNMMLVGEGFWTKRWGTKTYGVDAGGSEVDGSGEFIKTDGTRELIVVANGKVWRMTSSGKTEITGATFTAGTPCSMVQIGGYLYIVNGTDPMARYAGSTLTKYTAISAPANPALSRGAGLSTGDYSNYYQVTALNDIGETVGSTEVDIKTDIKRSEWDEADEYIDFDFDAVATATRYQIYYDDESGYEVLLDEVETNSYKDDGSKTPNPYIEVPDDNTTGGPEFADICVSDNRIWGTKDSTNKYRVYFSGTGVNLGTFSDFYGGGWVDLEKGGRQQPVAVRHYKSGTGDSNATVFCSTPDGKGSIWQISLESLTVEDTSFIVPVSSKIIGSVGTDASRSVVNVGDDIFFFNKNGVMVLGNEPNYWGVLRTNELSARIRPIVRNIDDSNIDKVCAYTYDQKVFFSIPKATSGNNKIIYYDLEQTCWVGEWDIGVTMFMQFTDSNDTTRLLGGSTSDGKMIEFSVAYPDDDGTAFSTSFKSPRFNIDKDWTKFAKVKKCFFKFNDLRGNIAVTVVGSGKTQDSTIQGTKTILTEPTNTGLGYDLMGTIKLGDSAGSPANFEYSSLTRYLSINKRLKDLQFQITTNTSESEYVLVGLKAEGSLLDTSDPSSWRLN